MSNVETNKLAEVQAKLVELRKDGEYKIPVLKQKIRQVKKSKTLIKEEKAELLEQYNAELFDAQEVCKANKETVKSLVKEARALIKEQYLPVYKSTKVENNSKIKAEKAQLKEELADAKNRYNEIVTKLDKNSESYAVQLAKTKSEHKNKLFEIKSNAKGRIQTLKDNTHSVYEEKTEELNKATNDALNFVEKFYVRLESYTYSFNAKDFFMKNGLYIIILLFMLVCIINNPRLLSINSIVNILNNFSYKIFFALGVAGLILLGGTDLSVGRMVTLGSLITCMFLNPSSPTKIFGMSISGIYDTIGFVPTMLIALVVSTLCCTLFSMAAGFFTAKFKIHPFITTLASSLVIWGLAAWSTGNVKTGTITDDALSLSQSIFKGNGFPGIPLTLIYAIITIAVVWFVWNKTKFGKNMYAVGGNPEAAEVSGISVFRTTLLVFGLAGILYGLGSFAYSINIGSSSSVAGQGWEMEAIAACVVGGISFSGGIGKISGAVIGCLLFEILKYYLRDFTGGNQDISNIFIGLIILVAVIFDSIKYLKKK